MNSRKRLPQDIIYTSAAHAGQACSRCHRHRLLSTKQKRSWSSVFVAFRHGFFSNLPINRVKNWWECFSLFFFPTAMDRVQMLLPLGFPFTSFTIIIFQQSTSSEKRFHYTVIMGDCSNLAICERAHIHTHTHACASGWMAESGLLSICCLLYTQTSYSVNKLSVSAINRYIHISVDKKHCRPP